MNKFTNDNTNGIYSETELAAMNDELAKVMADVDENDPNYDQIEKACSETILENH